jgi:hypothetical protein
MGGTLPRSVSRCFSLHRSYWLTALPGSAAKDKQM